MSKRFVYRPLSGEQMATIGNLVIADVQARIHKGLNVGDAPAKALKPGRNGKRGYPDYKTARGLQGIRDLVWRGLTMRSIRVISSKANEVRIGFDNPQAARIAAINQIAGGDVLVLSGKQEDDSAIGVYGDSRGRGGARAEGGVNGQQYDGGRCNQPG